MVYHSNDWDQYLDNDYILSGGNVATQTLRNRLRSIENIQDVRRLDFLFAAAVDPATGPGGEGFTATSTSPFTLLMVQMTPDVARAVNGMDITTVQWEGKGGMELFFKCLSGDTMFKTPDGDKKLRDVAGKNVQVLNRHDKWENAKAFAAGKQRLWKVSFEHMDPVYATAEHEWVMRDGKRVTTLNLKSVPFTGSDQDAKVVSIEDTGRDEEVFCCEVPESHSFTLANGLTTGNCMAIQVPQLRADFYGNCGIAHGTTA